MTDPIHLSIEQALVLLSDVFIQSGANLHAAESVAKALVAAESEGQAGHGFSRVADYAAQLRSGKVNGKAQISVQTTSSAAVHVDADHGFAYPALDAARAAGIPRAREAGIAVMTIGHSHHCGALSVQVEQIAQAGLIGLMVANTPKAIAPWGGKDALFGTNPIAFASPVEGRAPLVIDLSLSVVARGKVMAAQKAGTSLPEGWRWMRRARPPPIRQRP